MEAIKHRQPVQISEELAILMSLGEPIKGYLEKLVEIQGNIRKNAQKLIRLKEDFGFSAFHNAIEHAIVHKAYGIDYIENLLHRQPITIHPPVTLKEEKLNRIFLSQPMLADYDTFVLKRRAQHERCPQTEPEHPSSEGDAAIL
jgi:hypothetical protein